MKLILLAATALIATPVIAQTSGSTGTGSPTTAGAQGTPTDTAPADQTAPATDPAMQQAPTAPAEPAPPSDATTAAPTTASPQAMTTGDPVGGYQPTQPALSGTPAAGQTPQFQAAQSPAQAFPAPAPLASYPVCKKGQYDKCRQRGGK
jgi:hypothetical protein